MAKFAGLCANFVQADDSCQEVGRLACKNCLLVAYCGHSCQKSHWALHKLDCKSPLGSLSWQPAWVSENRTPSFIREGLGEHFGSKKYLWGNIPAIDIIRIGSNEGNAYNGDIGLLFAASGDLRNLVRTINQLPVPYNHAINATLNDRDIDIAARNIILLFIALNIEDADQAVDCMIHIWYSACVRSSHINILQERIRPLIAEVCGKVKGKDSYTLFGKTWVFGDSSLRVVLNRASWESLLKYFEAPTDLTATEAQAMRSKITLAKSRRDYRDRQLYCQPVSHRVPLNQFRRDGILLPFGSPRDDFQQPNPTLFQNTSIWPMKDSADPLEGWPSKEVADTTSGPAVADIYGKLFCYLHGTFQTFLHKITSSKVCFRVFQLDAIDLPRHLDSRTFSRIEASNIADSGWLGIHKTLCLMAPLLQPVSENPHATLITRFMNAVDETLTDEDRIREMTPHSSSTKRLLQYFPDKKPAVSKYDPQLIKFALARDIITVYDDIFDRYTTKCQFQRSAEVMGLVLKSTNSVVPKWPHRLSLTPGQPGAQEEFDRVVAAGLSGKECYVEWKLAR